MNILETAGANSLLSLPIIFIGAKSMNNIFYVYVYLDPRKPGKYQYGEYQFDYEPFYVGKGFGCRYKEHLHKNRGNCNNKYLKNKIQKIQREIDDNPIIVKQDDNLSEKSAFGLEVGIIDIIGRKDLGFGPLLNMTDGGEGCYNPPASVVRKGVETKRKNGSYVFSNGHRKKISESVKLCWGKSEYSGKIAKEWIITTPDNENLEIVNLHKFCRENGLSSGTMCDVAKGIHQQHKGWRCSYKNK